MPLRTRLFTVYATKISGKTTVDTTTISKPSTLGGNTSQVTFNDSKVTSNDSKVTSNNSKVSAVLEERAVKERDTSQTATMGKDAKDKTKELPAPTPSSPTRNGPTPLPKLELTETERLLMCGICHNILDKPKILPCVCSFCRKCVNGLLKTVVPPSTTFSCPVCRETVTVPRNKVDGFRDNHLVAQLQSGAGTGGSVGVIGGSEHSPCEICEEPGRRCEQQCVDCQELMCKACAKAHKRMKATKKHKVIKLPTPEPSKSAGKKGIAAIAQVLNVVLRCEQHREPATAFCMQCNIPVCPKCQSTLHRLHRTLDFMRAAAEKRVVLQITMTALCQKVGELQGLTANVETARSQLLSHRSLQLDGIEERRRAIVYTVNSISRALQETAEARVDSSLRLIARHHEQCRAQFRIFKTVIEYGNRLLEQGVPEDVIVAERDLVDRLRALDDRLKSLRRQALTRDVGQSAFVFVPGILGDVEMRNVFGELSEDGDSLSDVRRLEELFDEETQKTATPQDDQAPELQRAKEPWLPHSRRQRPSATMASPLALLKVKETECFRALTKALNQLTSANLSSQVVHILDSGVDTELKLEKLCSKLIGLVCGHPALVPTLALLCRTLTFLMVPSDGRPSVKSSLLNFLDRMCMKCFETGAGTYLSTGTTPQVSRSGSFSFGSSSSRPTPLVGRASMHTWSSSRSRKSSTTSITDVFDRNRSLYGSFGGSKKRPAPPPPRTLSRTTSVDTRRASLVAGSDPDERDEQRVTLARRRQNLCLVWFLCELYKLRVVAENIVHEWIRRLAAVQNDLCVEAVCAILFHVGRYLDHERARHIMDKVALQLNYARADRETSARLRYMIDDVIRRRELGWSDVRPVRYWRHLIEK